MDGSRAQQEDRLSDLPDGVLGHVLSFLGAKEAARAAMLSRRYRHAFAGVHTLSFLQEETSASATAGASRSDFSYRLDEAEQRRNAEFVALVDAAVSCRRRCAGGGRDPGLRALRVVFDAFHGSLADHIDRWLSAAAQTAGALEEIHVDARRDERGVCARERPDWYFRKPPDSWRTKEIKDMSDGEDSDEFRDPKTRDLAYRIPTWLYSSGAATGLRTLRLASCFLDLPPAGDAKPLHFPSVETMELICIPDSGKDIQRLVSSCGRLADLTLDSCRRVRALAVLDKRLRRLALRCCHGARLAVDATDLSALEYKGPVPGDSALCFYGSPPAILSCDIEFCGKMESGEAELAKMARFLGRFTAARWLRLGSSRLLGAGIDKISSNPLYWTPLPCIRHLELKGTLSIRSSCAYGVKPEGTETSSAASAASAMAAVARILEQTPNLEVLTLLILHDVDEIPMFRDDVVCDPTAGLDVPGVVPAAVIPCLRDGVREMNVVNYQGRVAQRMLLKVLLGAAAALEELYVVFPPAVADPDGARSPGKVHGSSLSLSSGLYLQNKLYMTMYC